MTSPGDDRWVGLLPGDPRPWLLAGEEPSARWVALALLLDRPPADGDVAAAHAAVLADPGTRTLLDRLEPWDRESHISGHDSPRFAPNRLSLLADMGITAEDDPRISSLVRSMLEHQDADGRFQALGRWRGMDEAAWGALPCDSHAIAETVARFGYGGDPRAKRAFKRLAADLAETSQGLAWPCRPDPAVGFRGPGRKSDFCPQVTLQALRAFSYLSPKRRPAAVVGAGRASLAAWRRRGESQPYMFGHGRRFKRGKWPETWYSALEFVDTLARYPELWAGPEADPADRRALAEVSACLAAYALNAEGRVVPRSCSRGFEEYSFGRKKGPSAFATARVAVALKRVNDLAGDIAAVDVKALGSSKGGSGTPLPPD